MLNKKKQSIGLLIVQWWHKKKPKCSSDSSSPPYQTGNITIKDCLRGLKMSCSGPVVLVARECAERQMGLSASSPEAAGTAQKAHCLFRAEVKRSTQRARRRHHPLPLTSTQGMHCPTQPFLHPSSDRHSW